MTTATEFRDFIQDNFHAPRSLQAFQEFETRTREHRLLKSWPGPGPVPDRSISRLIFTDGSFIDIDLTNTEDNLAFVPEGIYDGDQCVILHPEGHAAEIFNLINRTHAQLT